MPSMKSHAGPATPRARSMINDTTLKKIAHLAKIDSTKSELRKGFFLNLRAAINTAWIAPSGPSTAIYRGAVIKELARWGEAVSTLKELSNPDENDAAAVHALRQIRVFLSRDMKQTLDRFEDSWRSSLDAFERTVAKASDLVQRKYQKTGRRAGGLGARGLGNVGANIFVKSLIYAVETSGGHLKKSRKGEGDALQGPLIDAIDLLRPHLPDSLLPPATSVRFYEVIVAEVVRELKRHRD